MGIGSKTCYNCLSTDKKLMHKGVRDNANIDVYVCKKCGFVFLSTDEHISNEFYENGNMVNDVDLNSWINSTKDDDLRRFKALKKKIKNKVLCDFGCGNAGFLNLAKSYCKNVYGVELQQTFYDYFKGCELNIYPSIENLPEKADVITLFHVLEHLKNPVVELKKISSYLAKDGELVIEVPNADDVLLKLYKSKSFADFTYWSCHLFLYNKKTLSEIVKKSGLKIKKIRHIQRYGLVNHLYWLIKNKPAGHKKWAKFDFKPINLVYAFILSLFSMTDTIEITVEKIN